MKNKVVVCTAKKVTRLGAISKKRNLGYANCGPEMC